MIIVVPMHITSKESYTHKIGVWALFKNIQFEKGMVATLGV
jgi:hypothetical protein